MTQGMAMVGLRVFAHALESSHDLISITDLDDRFLFVNRAFLEAYGFTEEEVLGQHVSLIDSPNNPPEIRHQIFEETRGKGFSGELLNRRKDGSEFPLFLSTSQVKDQEGRVIGLVGIGRDFTERRAEETLRSALYRISEKASVATEIGEFYAFVHAVLRDLMYAENFYVALFDPATQLLRIAYYADDVDPFQESYRLEDGLTGYVFRTGERLLCSENPRAGEPARDFGELVRAGAITRVGKPSVDWLGVPLKSGDSTIGVLVIQTYLETRRFGAREMDILSFVARNIAGALDRKRSEEALRDSEERFRTLADATFEGIVIHEKGVILETNRAFAELAGIPIAQLIGRSVVQLAAPASRASLAEKVSEAPDAPYEIPLKRADGKTVVAQVQARDLHYQGRIVRVAAVRDVTDRVRLEDQLRQAQKMEAVGRLAGGVAHDFNNLLTTILGFSELLSDGFAADDPRRGEVEEIRRAGERAAALTNQLLAFSRKQILAPEVIDLNHVVRGLEGMLRRVIGEHIELVTTLEGALGSVRADPGQIEQVVVNLAVNARDAMPDGGTLTIETRNVESCRVQLSIRDTGHGMSAETRSHLFEPFFTTKEKGKGTGLGLSTVYGVIRQAGGEVEVESATGEGTAIRITLPCAETEARTASSSDSSRRAPEETPATETILLVEDEATVRQLARRFLEAKGYSVLEAPNGNEALERAASHAHRIDLLVTDLVMPGMSGREVAQRLSALRPGLKVLFVSGYTDDLAIRRSVAESDVPFLQKPFTADALARKVRQVLDSA